MKRLSHVLALVLIAGALVVTSSALAGEQPLKTDDDLVSAIQANTPEKHQEIAAWYKAKAADESSQAEQHRKMSKAYLGTKAAYNEQMSKHCDEQVALHEQLAASYSKMAAEHEAAARK